MALSALRGISVGKTAKFGLATLNSPSTIMNNDPFDLIDQAARQGGADSALDLLVTMSQNDKNYPLLFEGRLMQARHKIGLPLIFNTPLEDLPAEQRQTYEEAMREAARETGNLFLADGDIPQAWPYFRAIGDTQPVATAIEKINSHDQLDAITQLDAIIEIAFGQGVHPSKGFELLLKTHGICRAITFFGRIEDTRSREESALLLVRTLYGELIDNLKHAISRTEGQQPDGSSVTDLISGRDWLFGEYDSYVDAAHLTSIIPLALDFTDPETLKLAIELCEYGAHLSSNFQYRTDPPFDNFYRDHAIYLRALAGCDIDAAVKHFRQKIVSGAASTGPAQILVMLLTRLARYREAIEVALEYLGDQNPNQLACPSIPQLCQLAGDYDSLREVARRRGDMLNFTVAAIGR
jgi:hypothetical protein